MVSRIMCFAAVVGLVNGATFQGYPPNIPKELGHKEGCYVKEINDVIPYGEEVSPIGHCYRIECSKGMMYYSSCGTVLTDDPKCHITQTDVRKPHPECCPVVRCDVENNI